MTVINKRSRNIRVAEVHAQSHVVIGAPAAPKGDVHRVLHGRICESDSVDRRYQKMDLVHVEGMLLTGAILDSPLLYSSNLGADRGRFVLGEQLRLFSVDRDEEV